MGGLAEVQLKQGIAGLGCVGQTSPEAGRLLLAVLGVTQARENELPQMLGKRTHHLIVA